MTKYILPIALVLVTGCSTLDPLTESPFGDEEVGCDIPETTDEAAETETIGDAPTSETEPDSTDMPLCEFEIPTTDGVAIFSNTISVSLGQQSPDGRGQLGVMNVLDLNFSREDGACAAVPLVGFTIDAFYSNGWQPTSVNIVNNDTREAEYEGSLTYSNIALAEFIFEDESSHQAFEIDANLSGANEEVDDTVSFGLWPNSIRIKDINGVEHTLEHAGLGGGLFFF